jgi:hypothetical protein
MNPLQLLEKILDQFEDDPIDGWIHYPESEPTPVIVSIELSDLLDRANDLLYSANEGLGYATEEEEE